LIADNRSYSALTSFIRDRAASSSEMLAIFGDDAFLRAALNFEAALAHAEAEEDLISKTDAARIGDACASMTVDAAAIAEEAAHAGTLAIPLVRRLRAEVAQYDATAAGLVHLGATSQDLADTALVLQIKAGAALVEKACERIAAALAALLEKHIATPMLGRTLLQGALPITFGLKVANWLLAIDEALSRFCRERDLALILQFGGPTGSLTGLSGKAMAVAAHLSTELGLTCPLLPWQARRNGMAGLAAALAIVSGAIGKIARDISLLAQGEVGEAFEPIIPGRGGSSAMAHKRNPTGCQIALSAALRTPGLAATILSALPQEHERGLGGWQVEAPVLVELFQLTHGALLAMAPVAEGLEVDTGKMRANLDAAGVGSDIGESENMARRVFEHYRKTKECL
jgi:3-carboxy-cis,cis-muconate cycloisomerase